MSGFDAPKGMRLHIGIFGRRNVGKSSLLNAFAQQEVSIVAPEAGTTTDPVEKPMELLPLGPVVFVDTAGVDDEGALGELRVRKTRLALERVDLALLVAEPAAWGDFEEGLLAQLRERKTPVVVVFNKADLGAPPAALLEDLARRAAAVVSVCARDRQGMGALREALLAAAPEERIEAPTILSDLVGPGELALLVVPIDKEAPKGRLILPQAQAIRDLLDHGAMALVVQDRELKAALSRLARPPKLVVTDSQAFREVAANTPPEVPLTSFSILFSRFKGDLLAQVEGATAIERLKPGDRVLVAEACSHHPIGDDIGREKIPRWLNERVGGALDFVHVQGRDFPEDLSPFKLVVHCGGCTFNRRALLSRIARCQQARVPISNYGLVIAYSLGIFDRALGPFPEVLRAYRSRRQAG